MEEGAGGADAAAVVVSARAEGQRGAPKEIARERARAAAAEERVLEEEEVEVEEDNVSSTALRQMLFSARATTAGILGAIARDGCAGLVVEHAAARVGRREARSIAKVANFVKKETEKKIESKERSIFF